jgi:hypothetical protein
MANQSSVCPSHSAPFDMAVPPLSINTLFRSAIPQAPNIPLVYLNLPQPISRSQVPGRRNVVRVRVRAPEPGSASRSGSRKRRYVSVRHGMGLAREGRDRVNLLERDEREKREEVDMV